VSPRRRDPHRLAITAAAAEVLTDRLPDPVAVAVHAYLATTLVADPRGEGRQMVVAPLDRTWSARHGPYRVVYRIDEESRTVTVMAVGHPALAGG
jgi:mRNA interferase RelE/StbE